MTHDDRLTLDLFGSSFPTFGSDLGISTFARTAPDETGSDPDPVTPAAPAKSGDVRTDTDRSDFVLVGDRSLATGWRARARDNIAAVRLAEEIERQGRPATADEQARSIRFIGFGAGELANRLFTRPSESVLSPGWEDSRPRTGRGKGSTFAFADELAAKRRELLELDAALAAAGVDGDPRLAE